MKSNPSLKYFFYHTYCLSTGWLLSWAHHQMDLAFVDPRHLIPEHPCISLDSHVCACVCTCLWRSEANLGCCSVGTAHFFKAGISIGLNLPSRVGWLPPKC